MESKKAIKTGQAITRDGRLVIKLKESILDGKEVLTGFVTKTKSPFKKGCLVPIENCIWSDGGLAADGSRYLLDKSHLSEGN